MAARHPDGLGRAERTASAILAACLGSAAAVAHAQTLSPGPLSQAHASIDDPAHCGRCHETGRDVGAARCLECHPTARARDGLHADLVRSAGGKCGGCHAEHHGRSFRLVRFDAQMPGFVHDRTGFPLTGRHAPLDCARCHKGRLRYQGLSDRCASCHEDRHGGQLAKDCAACHRTDSFAGAAGFDHARSWPLAGRHATVPCAKCHPARGDQGDRKWTGIRKGTCSDCHADPHKGAMKRPCADCHVADGWKTLPVGAARDHAPGRFPLEGRHASVACDRCHGPRMERKVETRCASCHADPHGGRFSARCESCHDADGWRLRAGAAFDHDRTAYHLEGRHRKVACAACHKPGQGYAKRFKGQKHDACRDCHADPHRTADFEYASVAPDAGCEACHQVEGFVPARFDAARHDRARFPLAGAHRAVPCGRCHRRDGAEKPRLAIPQRACADCHADPHKGAFDARMGTKGCAACHSVSSWRAADFDHASTRFPLTGRHAGVPCRVCHGTDQGGASPRYAVADRRCAACHADAHAGQMSGPPRPRECGECHGTDTFKVVSFDHAARTGFALDGRHGVAACAACHPAVRLPSAGAVTGGAVTGVEVALYRPTDARCDGCHEDPHGRRLAGACADCHRPAASWRRVEAGVAFDHGGTGFPLAGRHAGVGCDRCHDGALRLAGGGGSGCAACHRDDPHRGREGPECEECHTPRGWAVGPEVRGHERTRFPLTGAHRVADCFACHAAVEPPAYQGTPRECAACHSTDYARPGNHPDHVAAGFPMRCDECHGTYDWGQARVRHSWWTLRGAHATADCFRCHPGGRYAGTPRDCLACHQADWDRAGHAAAGFPTRCEGCHSEGACGRPGMIPGSPCEGTTGGWGARTAIRRDRPRSRAPGATSTGRPKRTGTIGSRQGMSTRMRRVFPVILAATTSVLLAGSERSCAPARRVGDHPATADCWSCHGDRWAEASAPDHEGLGFPRDCSSCHATTGWAPASSGKSHRPDGEFPLTGGHAGRGCADCHGATTGNLDPACVACHLDDYDSTTAPPHGPGGIPQTCADCHDTAGWRPAKGGGPHGPTDAFPLTGGHAGRGCADCHGATVGKLDPACVACHLDDYDATTAPPHGPGGIPQTCADCHDAAGWKPAKGGGPHGPTNAFPLTGGHAGRGCADCHGATIGKLDPACVACHVEDWTTVKDPDHVALAFPKTCQECHKTSAWTGATMGPYHDFPLGTKKHAGLACAACHLPGRPWADYSCIDCHEHGKAGTDSDHWEVAGYSWESKACVKCHPNGTHEED
ncbi:MAG: hypothetical protein FJ087_19475 [Deltaproteobacteria bacterium]|nr:hypothetical protein [Deltaproteobacteria bacterium]